MSSWYVEAHAADDGCDYFPSRFSGLIPPSESLSSPLSSVGLAGNFEMPEFNFEVQHLTAKAFLHD